MYRSNSHRFSNWEAANILHLNTLQVRYESRKKLAEQRPRVKGQFVRQVQADPMHTEAERHYGNSSDG